MSGTRFAGGWSTHRTWIGGPDNRVACTTFSDPRGRVVDVVLGYAEFDWNDEALHVGVLTGGDGIDIVTGEFAP